ncbi:hypothetical protein ACWD7M_16265 [Streptomyces griseus]
MSTTAGSTYHAYRAPDNVRQAQRRKSARGVAVYPMRPLAPDAPLEEWAAYLEAQQTEHDYMATYRETHFMHPLVKALSEYQAVTQSLHGRMEYTRLYGASSLYDVDTKENAS